MEVARIGLTATVGNAGSAGMAGTAGVGFVRDWIIYWLLDGDHQRSTQPDLREVLQYIHSG